ncbi:F0F1 ATP synthase subunit B [Polymorphobacter fuscus]|uniref:ATP synthase subunit b n=1 Tax=Sandarakinorhabdus fusca TaxID=1439888 RepID=A0A7C9GRT2_9SPHN|nr:F0F1 ATP synthase subunit B [Polymorphobacter fuscus]KAB7643693.1 F0F1 ATP synthase subunit B [Polymorphobacter fuscus]MQT18636.1 F0F1 ATP synthase subunit B [Polymorphobacter fuscus]NJC08148.1 F-type H+-transporting ATPase subunit b [Polymorphobacter fuscus]
MVEPSIDTIETQAMTAEGAHEGPLLLGLNAEAWVSVSMFIFFALAIILAKLPQRIAGALDDRIAGVKRQLDEAKAIRAEAEALLAGATRARDAATRDAEAIVARAEAEAAELINESRRAAELTIERRTVAAEAKIAAAERAAEADLRADVARRVTAAAATLIAAKADPALQARMTDDAILGLERRLH